MRRLMLLSAAAAFAGLAWWHLPAVAQRAAQPAASEAITFEQYRDFQLHDLAQRRARLATVLPKAKEAAMAAPGERCPACGSWIDRPGATNAL